MKVPGAPMAVRRRPGVYMVALAFALAVIVPVAVVAAKPASSPVNIQVLSISDWHGQLPALAVGAPPVQIGGAAAIAAYWQADRAANPNTLTLTAGDDFGASPPVSSFFGDQPAVIAQRMMGIQIGALGNHNFDRGVAHLQSQIDLAAAPTDADHPGTPYRYVAANLRNLKENLSGVDPVRYFRFGPVKVAVIGITNEEAPTLVFPGSFGTIQITDSAAAVNKFARIARANGSDAVFVITHKGMRGLTPAPFGELVDLANAVEPGMVDVIFGDHTDIQYTGTHNGILVVESRSKGVSYARTNVTVVPGNTVTGTSVSFVTPTVAAVTPDPAISSYVSGLTAALAPILGQVIGQSSTEVLRSDSCGRSDGRICESRVGNAVTDAMRQTYGSDFAITNSGGLRAHLTCPAAGSPAFCPTGITAPPYPITRGSVLGVLPFGNVVATLSVNGAELKAMLEHGVSSMPGANGRFAQVSGLCFAYDISAAVGSRVVGAVRQAADGSCTGPPVDLTAASSYTIATNDFMASGGDGYPNFSSRMVTREVMDEVVADWVAANSPIGPSIQGRIVCTTSGPTVCPAITAP